MAHWGAHREVTKFFNTYCRSRSCKDVHENKTLIHFLGKCPALAKAEECAFGKYFMDFLKELSKTGIKEILEF